MVGAAVMGSISLIPKSQEILIGENQYERTQTCGVAVSILETATFSSP